MFESAPRSPRETMKRAQRKQKCERANGIELNTLRWNMSRFILRFARDKFSTGFLGSKIQRTANGYVMYSHTYAYIFHIYFNIFTMDDYTRQFHITQYIQIKKKLYLQYRNEISLDGHFDVSFPIGPWLFSGFHLSRNSKRDCIIF